MASFAEVIDQFKNGSRLALEDLEAERLKLKNNKKVALSVGLAIIGIGFFSIIIFKSFMPFILGVILAVCVYFIYGEINKKEITARWKNLVIQKLVRSLGNDFTYHANDRVEEREYNESRIFLTDVDRFSGEDLIEGTIGKTYIKFSELKTEYKTSTKSSTRWTTIFKGVFMIADFNKDFNVNMVVLPDVAQNIFGVFGQALQSMNASRDSLVKLENTDFEKAFVVYADDQVQARYILTPSFMERILELKYSLPGKLYLSFSESNLYIAFEASENYFEPDFEVRFTSISEIKTHFDHLMSIVQIIENLDLNTRIWTKK